jgi:hypothetical protein
MASIISDFKINSKCIQVIYDTTACINKFKVKIFRISPYQIIDQKEYQTRTEANKYRKEWILSQQ